MMHDLQDRRTPSSHGSGVRTLGLLLLVPQRKVYGYEVSEVGVYECTQ